MDLYLIIVVVLFALAISDLVVGVSNDAVNFLNSAIGSKAAPFKIIMLVAALGILFGATFSSGMMEVARKGIFHPQEFYFNEIMIIFLAVMLTDIILLDLFNTFGMPTSTTVSIVFEILGASVAVAIIKLTNAPGGIENLGNYINTAKALAIISGILLSVVVAFTVGLIVQYISRLIFSFNYKKVLKYFGAIWGGLAITAITHFILLKGAKGSSFMDADTTQMIKTNSGTILLYSFFVWTLLLQILHWIFRVNILKIIVLVGTFALAMAFAGNDLVNFIGVPLAGYESFKAYQASTGFSPDTFLMADLQGKVKTPTLFLLIAGGIMVITLWTSRKARSVVKTTLDLSRQTDGDERFQSSAFARTVVRWAVNASKFFEAILPDRLINRIKGQFSEYHDPEDKQADVSFDLIRASVNLIVASVLIAFATSLKLPLSTTYVTFMVAMGTSLADGAWGRESAVYRITGVIAVIGGWFFTAFSAFSVAFIVALLISWIGPAAIVLFIALAIFIVIRTHMLHKKRSEEQKTEETEDVALSGSKILNRCNKEVGNTFNEMSDIYSRISEGLIGEKRKVLKNAYIDSKTLNKTVKKYRANIQKTIRKLEEDSIETGHYYVQVLDYLKEISDSMIAIARPSYDHVDNNHKMMSAQQRVDMEKLYKGFMAFVSKTGKLIDKNDYSSISAVESDQQEIFDMINKLKKNQIKLLKKAGPGTKISLLYMDILSETKNLVSYTVNVLKSARDFEDFNNGKQH